MAVFSAAEEVGIPMVLAVAVAVGLIGMIGLRRLRIRMILLSISSMRLFVGLFSLIVCISPSRRLRDWLPRRERKFPYELPLSAENSLVF